MTARRNSLEIWQSRWTNETRGRWTARLIPQLKPWVNRKEGEVNYYLTQFLTGHGLFHSYLFKMGKVTSASCLYGESLKDDAEHNFFGCKRWNVERDNLQQSIGNFTPDNIMQKMIEDTQQWTKVSSFVEKVLKLKKEDIDQL